MHCARNLTTEEINEAYEKNTGVVIIETFETRGINPKVKPAPDNIKDKHFYRKHGENAYYGQ